MKVKEILSLLKAGYTKDEIQAMASEAENEAENAENAADQNHGEQDPEEQPKENARLDSIEQGLKDLQKSFQDLNITFARQPEKEGAAPSTVSAEDIISKNFLGGKIE